VKPTELPAGVTTPRREGRRAHRFVTCLANYSNYGTVRREPSRRAACGCNHAAAREGGGEQTTVPETIRPRGAGLGKLLAGVTTPRRETGRTHLRPRLQARYASSVRRGGGAEALLWPRGQRGGDRVLSSWGPGVATGIQYLMVMDGAGLYWRVLDSHGHNDKIVTGAKLTEAPAGVVTAHTIIQQLKPATDSGGGSSRT